MIDESLLAKVASLSPDDRLKLIGAVWDTLSPDDLPVTDAERALLDARLADMERNPDDQSPWRKLRPDSIHSFEELSKISIASFASDYEIVEKVLRHTSCDHGEY